MECFVSVSTTETGSSSLANDFAADLAAASELKMTEWAKADAPKGAPAAPPPAEDKAPVEAPAQGSSVSEAEQAKPEETPAAEAAPAPDLSWLPDEFREKVSTLDPEVAEWMKGNVLRQSDYTKKTQKVAALTKEAEAVKAKADLWEQLSSNPALSDFAYRVLKGEAQIPGAAGAEPADDGVDLTAADNATIKRYIATQVEKRAAEIAAAQIRERVEKPLNQRTAVLQALTSYATENKVDEGVMLDAITRAEAHAARLGVTWTPENAAALVEPFVVAAKAPATPAPSKPAAPPASGGLSKVASPSSRPAAVVPPPMPKHLREKRQPSSNEERVADVLYQLREKHGIELTPNDLDRLVRGV